MLRKAWVLLVWIVQKSKATPDCGTIESPRDFRRLLGTFALPIILRKVSSLDTGWPSVPRTGPSEGLITPHTHLITWPHSLCQDHSDLLAAKARPPDQVVSSSIFLGAAPSLQLTLLPALGRQEEL